jgi:hypothetical protein
VLQGAGTVLVQRRSKASFSHCRAFGPGHDTTLALLVWLSQGGEDVSSGVTRDPWVDRGQLIVPVPKRSIILTLFEGIGILMLLYSALMQSPPSTIKQ